MHLFAVFLAQERLDDVVLRDVALDQDLPGRIRRVLVVLLQELCRRLTELLIRGALQVEVLLADEAPVAHEEELGTCVAVIAHQGDHVLIDEGGGEHLLSLPNRLQSLDLIPQAGGPLEVEAFRGALHLLAQLLQQGILPAFQEETRLLHSLAILLLADLPCAGTAALVDVVVEAQLLGLVPRHLMVAGAEAKDATEERDALPDGARVGVGPEVAVAILLGLAHQHQAGVLLGQSDTDVRVVLVVAQAHVESRAILLDQVALKDERLKLGICDDPIDVGNLAHETPDLRRVIGGGVEIGAHTVAQRHRLAYVQHIAGRVLHQI